MDEPKVLFVDDDPNLLRAYSKICSSKPYKAITCSDPFAALELVSSLDDLAIVFSDYNMPRMNGETFLKKVREIRPDSSRILMSSYSLNDITEDRELVHYALQKPVEAPVLIQVTNDFVAEYNRKKSGT